jgi:diguanylate cyclase (GGDEF)-like protein
LSGIWRRLQSTPRAYAYPALGVLLALVLLFELPIVHALQLRRLSTASNLWEAYAYVILSSLGLVTTLGFLLGRWHDRARLLSFTDPLTGLFNRRYFSERMNADLSRARRSGGSICVLCIDMDHLKRINDGLGHRAGDAALVAVAGTISKNLRLTDVVARFGGDEFVVLLPETSVEEASFLSERIVREVSRLSRASSGQIEVSIGVSALNATTDPKDMLEAADEALYQAKAAGGGHAAIAEPGRAPSRRRPRAPMEGALLSNTLFGSMALDGQVMNRRLLDAAAARSPLPTPIASSTMGGAVQGGRSPCVACQRVVDVRPQDGFEDLGFCDDCLDGARSPVPEAELGGEC